MRTCLDLSTLSILCHRIRRTRAMENIESTYNRHMFHIGKDIISDDATVLAHAEVKFGHSITMKMPIPFNCYCQQDFSVIGPFLRGERDALDFFVSSTGFGGVGTNILTIQDDKFTMKALPNEGVGPFIEFTVTYSENKDQIDAFLRTLLVKGREYNGKTVKYLSYKKESQEVALAQLARMDAEIALL